jgi:hypothetical protein
MLRSARRSSAGRQLLGLLVGAAAVVYVSVRAGKWLADTGDGRPLRIALPSGRARLERLSPTSYALVPTPEYGNLTCVDSEWRALGNGLDFKRVNVLRAGQEVDTVAVVRVDRAKNDLRPVTGYQTKGVCAMRTLAEWQRQTCAPVVFNSAQYMAEPHGRPCALLKCDGVAFGPDFSTSIRGALVSQPTRAGLPSSDLLDFDYAFGTDTPSRFSRARTKSVYDATIAYRLGSYRLVVCHWPILIDREGRIRVARTDRQARRTVVAKDCDGNLLVLATEGDFFTLHGFGRLLKDDRRGLSPAFNVRTAMNLDGGSPSGLVINTPSLQYASCGPLGASGTDLTVLGVQVPIPTVVCVEPRP